MEGGCNGGGRGGSEGVDADTKGLLRIERGPDGSLSSLAPPVLVDGGEAEYGEGWW